MIEGFECRCGFKTISTDASCPRCMKKMTRMTFLDEGKVLSYAHLQIPPEGFDTPLDLAMVEIEKGPKLVCWTDKALKIDDRVKISFDRGIFRCDSLP